MKRRYSARTRARMQGPRAFAAYQKSRAQAHLELEAWSETVPASRTLIRGRGTRGRKGYGSYDEWEKHVRWAVYRPTAHIIPPSGIDWNAFYAGGPSPFLCGEDVPHEKGKVRWSASNLYGARLCKSCFDIFKRETTTRAAVSVQDSD